MVSSEKSMSTFWVLQMQKVQMRLCLFFLKFNEENFCFRSKCSFIILVHKLTLGLYFTILDVIITTSKDNSTREALVSMGTKSFGYMQSYPNFK